VRLGFTGKQLIRLRRAVIASGRTAYPPSAGRYCFWSNSLSAFGGPLLLLVEQLIRLRRAVIASGRTAYPPSAGRSPCLNYKSFEFARGTQCRGKADWPPHEVRPSGAQPKAAGVSDINPGTAVTKQAQPRAARRAPSRSAKPSGCRRERQNSNKHLKDDTGDYGA